MKTIADIVKALEAAVNGATIEDVQAQVQSIIGDLNEVDTTTAAEFKKKNNEAKGLRDRLKASETLQATMDALKGKHSKLLSTLGLDDDLEELDEALVAITTKLQAGELSASKNQEFDSKLKELNTNIQKLTKDLTLTATERDQLKTQVGEEKGKRQNAIKNQAILAALTEGKVVKPKEISKLVSQYVNIGDDDALVFVNEKGEEVEFAAGIKDYLKNNPEFIINDQNPGAGGGGNNNNDGGKGKIKATMAQMKDPVWYAKNRDAIMKDQVEFTN